MDLLVAGGGTAGCAAAVAAARRGCKVLLVEESNSLGGVSTTGGVCEWFASTEGLGDIFDRVRQELAHFGVLHRRFYNTEYLKIAWQLLCDDAGVDILFHSSVAGVERAGPRIRHTRVASCSRTMEIEAAYFIDATGEGDLGALAGAEFAQGHPESGRTLHMTLTFLLHDTGAPVTPYLPDGFVPIERAEELPGLNAHIRLPDGRVYCNMTKVMGHDPTDPTSLSHAEREARWQLVRVLHYLQRFHYPTHALVSSGARIGIREGRRLVGDHILTGEEILSGAAREHADGVAVATAQIDFHSLTRPGHTGWRQRVEPYPIPFRCLVARGFENLLVAGKCVSGDQFAQSSYRMTPTCCAIGQAAGTAVALAVQSGVTDVREVPVADLQGALREDGMELDATKHQAFAPEVTPAREAAD